MDGSEGIKLLYIDRTEVTTDIGAAVVLFGLIAMIALAFTALIYRKSKKKFYAALASLTVVTAFLLLFNGYYKEIVTYVVTPVEDKYSINLEKYEITGTQGEIIYLIEKGAK